MKAITADGALAELEQMALDAEEAHRYRPLDERTVSHVIDDDGSWNQVAAWAPRVVLNVSACYSRWAEDKIAIVATASIEKALEKHPQKVHSEYSCDWEGSRIELTRDQAVKLLYERDLPRAVREYLQQRRKQAVEQAAQDRNDPELFESLNRIKGGSRS